MLPGAFDQTETDRLMGILLQRQQAADLLGRIHPTLGMWGLLDPKVSGAVNTAAAKVGGWALGRLGLQKALGSFASPLGGLFIGAGFDALARLARRPAPRGNAQSVYESYAAGAHNIQNARINQAATVAADTPREMLSAARNTGNRQAGAAVAQAVAPELLRNAQQMFQSMLDAAAQYDLNNRRMLMENILQMRQLQQQRELAEAELKAQRQQRMLALLPALMQMGSGSNKNTA
jgi:DNA-binding transcriptional regulator YdaS (Cro superfamily)